MSDRELWVRTLKTVGAMVGGTVVFLGSMTMILAVMGGPARASASASETRAGSGTGPAMTTDGKGEGVVPNRSPRHFGKGDPHGVEARPGESI